MVFATAVTCIDGRAHQPVIDYLKRVHGVDTVDLVSAPGVNKLLAEGIPSAHTEFLKGNASVSITAHQAGLIAVVGHYDCAGNPVDEQQHQRDIVAAVRTVAAWDLGVKVIGLWVDSAWSASEVGATKHSLVS